MDIKKKVINLCKKYKASDIYTLSDHLNIDVNFAPLGTLNGFFRYSKRNTFIVINSKLESDKRNKKIILRSLI